MFRRDLRRFLTVGLWGDVYQGSKRLSRFLGRRLRGAYDYERFNCRAPVE